MKSIKELEREISLLRRLLRKTLDADRYDWVMGLEDRVKEALARKPKKK